LYVLTLIDFYGNHGYMLVQHHGNLHM